MFSNNTNTASVTLNSKQPLKKLMWSLDVMIFGLRAAYSDSYTPSRELRIQSTNIKSEYMSQFIYHSDNHNLTIEEHINQFYPEKNPDDVKTIRLFVTPNLSCDPNAYQRYGLAAFSHEDAKKLLDHESPDSMYSHDLKAPVKLNNRYYDREKLIHHLKNQLSKYSKSMCDDDLVCPSGYKLPAELIRAINHIRDYNINLQKKRKKVEERYGYQTIKVLYGSCSEGEIRVALEHLWKTETDLKEYTQQLKADLEKIKKSESSENKNAFFPNAKPDDQSAPSNTKKEQQCVIF